VKVWELLRSLTDLNKLSKNVQRTGNVTLRSRADRIRSTFYIYKQKRQGRRDTCSQIGTMFFEKKNDS